MKSNDTKCKESENKEKESLNCLLVFLGESD
jgi:hypothetical protein